jgi:hypothetical protein
MGIPDVPPNAMTVEHDPAKLGAQTREMTNGLAACVADSPATLAGLLPSYVGLKTAAAGTAGRNVKIPAAQCVGPPPPAENVE